MTVATRIKILDCKDCKSVEEIENRINNFLQEKQVKRFLGVNYMLDIGAVFLEYMTSSCADDQQIIIEERVNQVNPYNDFYRAWLRMFNPYF